MKKLLTILLVFLLIASSAFAEPFSMQLMNYNAVAKVAGAPELDQKQAVEKGDNIYFYLDHVTVGFELSALGIRTGMVLADDEENAADYLCSCFAMLLYFGGIDMTAQGALLQQFAYVRSGKNSTPYAIGTDVFQIVTTDSGKYTFVYMNNDMQTTY